MKFMLLFQLDEKRWAELPGAERDGLMSDCDRYAQEMVTSGHARQCAALHLHRKKTRPCRWIRCG